MPSLPLLVGLSNLTGTQVNVTMDVTLLLNIATDRLQFLTESSEVTRKSASHKYYPALSLHPQSSILRKLYCQEINFIVRRVVNGVL